MEKLDQIPGHQLVRLLERGGMGEVYLAQRAGPAGFNKVVVLKRIRRELLGDPQFLEMFLNEARLAACLSHPNVVQVFDLVQDDGGWFFTMEFVHGASLRTILSQATKQGQPIPLGVLMRICTDSLWGLHHAHTLVDQNAVPLQIVHRDVSPDNLLVAYSGQSKVTDFGIAKAMGLPSVQSGLLKGKFHFMAPELIEGRAPDARADIYSMGVVLYRALTGRPPFEGTNEAGLLNAVLNQPVVPVRACVSQVPDDLAELVEKALARDRNNRWRTALEMAEALERCIRASRLLAGQAEVATYLRGLFGEGVTLSSPAVQTPVPTPTSYLRPLPPEPLPPTLVPEADSVVIQVVEAQTVAAQMRRRFNRRLALGLAALLLVGVGLGAASVPAAQLVPAPPVLHAPAREAAAPPPAVQPPVAVNAVPAPPPSLPKADQPGPPRRVARIVAPPVQLAPGRVELRVSPWANVTVDGRAAGTTPMPALELAAGHHVIVLSNDELDVTRQLRIRVQPGQVQVLKVDLFR